MHSRCEACGRVGPDSEMLECDTCGVPAFCGGACKAGATNLGCSGGSRAVSARLAEYMQKGGEPLLRELFMFSAGHADQGVLVRVAGDFAGHELCPLPPAESKAVRLDNGAIALEIRAEAQVGGERGARAFYITSQPVHRYAMICDGCEGTFPKKLGYCGLCQQAHYCSVKCQKRDWPKHKTVCIGRKREAVVDCEKVAEEKAAFDINIPLNQDRAMSDAVRAWGAQKRQELGPGAVKFPLDSTGETWAARATYVFGSELAELPKMVRLHARDSEHTVVLAGYQAPSADYASYKILLL